MQALVVAAHGSHLNPDAARPAFDHADRVRATGAFDEVRAAFWKEQPEFREVLRTLESDEVFVVPLFMAEGYFTTQVVPRELRLEGWDGWESDGTSAGHVTHRATDVGKTVHYCGPVGTSDAMTDVVVRRAESVTGEPDVGEGVGLAVVGHGTERNEDSAKTTEYHADRIRERGRFEAVRALFMDEDPRVDDLTDHFATEDVVLVPLFVADGYHTREDVPVDVGLTGDAAGGWAVPAEVDGHRVWYAGAVGTEPLVAGVLLDRARDAGAGVPDVEPPETVDDPPGIDPVVGEAGEAFLAWVRDGGERTFGQLHVVHAGGADDGGASDGGARDGGTRDDGAADCGRYQLRHVADADREPAALDPREPAEARTLRRTDDRGRYRPLAFAPTLATGWAMDDLGDEGLLAAVESIYPAAVANWHRERRGDLDVTHWRTAAERHTGIYATVEELPDHGVGALAEALCGDCAKRRRWELGEGEPLDADGRREPHGDGDGEIPCREPCSLAIAAAREFLTLERDGRAVPDPADDGRWESLEAAADRRVEGVREGALEEPTNPYRARYLRARARQETSR